MEPPTRIPMSGRACNRWSGLAGLRAMSIALSGGTSLACAAQGDATSQATALTIAGFLAALIAFILGWIFGGRLRGLTIPPGPAPTGIRLKNDMPVVVIHAAPDNRLDGARFRISALVDPGARPQYSRIVVSGPNAKYRSAYPPYELPLSDAHIDLMNHELEREDPGTAELEFTFDPDDANSLYARLAAAYRLEPSAQFIVTIECWYEHRGKYLLSAEDRALPVREY